MTNAYINIKLKLATYYSLMFSSNMKVFLILSSFFLAAQAATSYEDIILKEWALYKAEHGKSYTNQDEDAKRMEIFLENKLFVAEHNAKFHRGETTFDVELNKFSDWLPEEKDRLYGLSREKRRLLKEGKYSLPHLKKEKFVPPKNATIPEEVNWVTAGAVSSVKEQGNCGACYAFAAAGALEGQMVIAKKKKLESLSVQNIIDCSRDEDNYGCGGGYPHYCFSYVKHNKGLNADKDYPYEAKEGRCRYRPDRIAATCRYSEIEETEKDLKQAIATVGPITACIDASQKSFELYKSGVYYEPKCTNWYLVHAVLVVGYGVDPATKQEYWLLKNSWGTQWGDKGYMKMARNKNNMCGIVTLATYAVV